MPFHMTENVCIRKLHPRSGRGQFPVFRLFQGFFHRQPALHIRKLPESGKKAFHISLVKCKAVASDKDKDGSFLHSPSLLPRPDRQFGDPVLCPGHTVLCKRTVVTERCPVRNTDSRSQFHPALGQFPSFFCRTAFIQGNHSITDRFLCHLQIDTGGVSGETCDHPENISVHGRRGLSEADRCYGPGGIGADPGKPQDLLVGFREMPFMLFADHYRCLL